MLLLSLLALALAACDGGAPVCVDEYIVNKTSDTNDGACTADDCSLREAVRNANACAGWQTITLPAGETSYTENPPFGGPYTYAVEAFNKDAVSAQATVVEEGCN